MHRIIFTIFILLVALRADAAMVRVIAVENGETYRCRFLVPSPLF